MTTRLDERLAGLAPDYLIVGGGSAGCVLAARLSEDPGTRVLLVEAGPDVCEDSMPDAIRSSYPSKAFFTREYFFPDFFARFGDVPSACGRERPLARYEQARVLGGGSTINGLCGNRGAPSDYDEWVELGAEGWGWSNVLPYFRALERDLDFAGDFHGADGPVPLRRLKESQTAGFVRRTVAVLKAQGFTALEDQNGEWRDGVMPVAITANEAENRASVAICYLTAAVRRRPNLTIVTDCQVARLVSDQTGIIGAELVSGGEPLRVLAREVIVSCGAINTPALLMRSGLGPAAALREAGVAVHRDIPGVGKHLMEHPAIGISCFVKPGQRHLDQTRHHTQAHLRFSSGVEGCPSGDMHMAVLARSAWHRVGGQLGTYYLWINKAYSQGQVRLRSGNPDAPPDIDFRLLSDPRDLKRMREGFRRIAALALDPGLDDVRLDVFPTAFSDRVRNVSLPGRWNAFQTAVLATILDFARFARPYLIRRLIAPVDIRSLLADDVILDDYLHRTVVGVWHAVGTCRMGPADDPLAVTDNEGHVHDVPGLRVCDASLMPSVPCANTNIPTIMIAERVADLIKAETRRAQADQGRKREVSI
ncbi:GMC family oxidoreductase [Pseudochelatococcus sp. B33]